METTSKQEPNHDTQLVTYKPTEADIAALKDEGLPPMTCGIR